MWGPGTPKPFNYGRNSVVKGYGVKAEQFRGLQGVGREGSGLRGLGLGLMVERFPSVVANGSSSW